MDLHTDPASVIEICSLNSCNPDLNWLQWIDNQGLEGEPSAEGGDDNNRS